MYSAGTYSSRCASTLVHYHRGTLAHWSRCTIAWEHGRNGENLTVRVSRRKQIGEKARKGVGEMRIYDSKMYYRATVPGISGFQQYDKRELSVVNGRKARSHKLEIIGEFDQFPAKYRVRDGHIPECCPVYGRNDARVWLESNPFGEIEPLVTPSQLKRWKEQGGELVKTLDMLQESQIVE